MSACVVNVNAGKNCPSTHRYLNASDRRGALIASLEEWGIEVERF